MPQLRSAFLHYTAPPIVGGVEAVIQAHAQAFLEAGYPAAIVAGRGEKSALPPEAELILIPEIDSLHPQVAKISAALEQGNVSRDFDETTVRLGNALAPVLSRFDTIIVHNVFTKHFNLPLTAALHRLLDAGVIRRCIAWCHDFTWASPRSRSKVHPGYPWDLLRTSRPDVTYVVVSRERQLVLADLLQCPAERIRVVYNGVAPDVLLGLSPDGHALADRLGLLECDLVLLMPVRVTQAKNIECALRVAAHLKEHGCRLRLIITGPPDPHDAHSLAYFRSLQTLRRELGVEKEARFVFECGAQPDEPLLIEPRIVGDLYRVSDVMFMPSHREGFGMPVLEAAWAGVPVVCSGIPAAREIGGDDVVLIDAADEPAHIAGQILDCIERNPVSRLRRRARREYSWRAIFHRDIEPLLDGEANR